MRLRLPLLLSALLLASALPASGQSTLKAGDRFAVLDFWTDDESIDPAYIETFTDLLRGAAAEAAGDRFAVMRRETMIQLLPARELRCGIGDCIATIGQMLQAQLVTGGTLRRLGNRVSVTIEAYDTTTSAMLGSKVLFAANFDEALDVFGSEATTLLSTWLPEVGQPPSLPGRGTVRILDDAPRQRRTPAPPRSPEIPRRTTAPAAFVDVLVHDVDGRELDGARVLVNGRLEGNAPRAIRLEPGTHTVSVERSLYFSAETTVNVSAGDTRRLAFTLEPNFGTVSIDSTPSGATVSLDGIRLGITPLSGQRVPPGTHQIHLELDDHVPEVFTVDIGVGDDRDIWRWLAPDFGPLTIHSEPPGARVILDGQDVGTTPLILDKVRSGRRTVEILGDATAYEPFVTRVVVEREIGGPLIDAVLERKESELVVTTNPPGATVQLDGNHLGTTTYRGALLGGDYELRIVREGFIPLTRHLEHRPPRPSLISLDLRRGGTGPGGLYTAEDIGLRYEPEPAPPRLEPVPNVAQYEFRLGVFLMNALVGAAIGGLTGYGLDLSLSEDDYSYDYHDDYDYPAIGVFTGLGAVLGACLYVALNSNHIWRPTGQHQDPAVVARNAERQRRHELELERVREHNRLVDERLAEENARLTSGQSPKS